MKSAISVRDSAILLFAHMFVAVMLLSLFCQFYFHCFLCSRLADSSFQQWIIFVRLTNVRCSGCLGEVAEKKTLEQTRMAIPAYL